MTNATTPYCGPVPLPEKLLGSWNLDPALLALLAVMTLAGAVGLRRARAGRLREGAFSVAALGAVIAFVAPLCALTVALFAARSLHHLLLLGLIAPALAVALPWRGAPGAGAFVALSAALWAWHVPAVYAAAWDSVAVYWGMQAALLLPAWAFWSAVLSRRTEAMATLGAAMMIAGLAGQMGLIGAILTFAPRPLYAEHLVGAEAFGMSLLADQQLAGLVMWVPGMAPLALLGALLLRRVWRQGLAA
ncbi:cytochrome c oxidase assembly protein [Alkalilacustris brevis]|uniref:cytochrome c oxidase assembly protein n=1 Tax=Alkalilacustris brevis TaxID=2026338 RepID=UPI000E0CFE0F|nr:cytochrome c oxidase assembly protein [Alkalilacustris brevis]